MSLSRRGLLSGITAASYSRLRGANDRVQVGFIGYGLMGAHHVYDFKNQADVDCAAVAEVYQPRLEQGVAACGGRAKSYRDFRRMLDNKDLQAVVVSTPDHWHALATILSCAAGKDVYVEKPLTLFVREGRWMIDAARRWNRIVQVGTQQRSGRHYGHARELIRSGYIGRVLSARMGSARNVMPGFGNPPDAQAPAEFDYDMWLGPAPKRPYNPNRGLYHFRWYWDYSGGQMTNLGAHELDIVHWFLDLKAPAGVYSTGGRFALTGDGETPDTQDAIFQYPKFQATYSMREASAAKGKTGLEFNGTKGTMVIGRGGYDIFSDNKIDPGNSIPVFQGHPAGGPQKSNTKPQPWLTPKSEKGSSEEQLNLHVRNFIDCVKSRNRPIADVEEGHQVAAACHLANISLRTGRQIRWDPTREQILNDPEANAMLTRPYRKPWDEALRALKL